MELFEKIIDITTGEEELKPYSKAQLKEAEELATKAKLEEEITAANNLKKLALLEKLGITEDEAKLLLS